MKVFLDFEASSLSDQSFPVEVAWVFQDGQSESHLIRPAAEWTDWDEAAQAIHGISREKLASEGEPHHLVAARMVQVLSGHDLFASAPSWDGKWLSALLRGAGLPRHALRLRDTDEALRATANDILRTVLPSAELDEVVRGLVSAANAGKAAHPAHRALADAQGEFDTWRRLQQGAYERAAQSGGS